MVGTPWLLLPIGVLAERLTGEVQRSLIRQRLVGEPPIEAVNVGCPVADADHHDHLAVYRYALSAPGWRGRDLRIAHLSDLHVNGDLSGRVLPRGAVARRQANPICSSTPAIW